ATVKLGPTNSPRTIDVTFTEGERKGQTAVGVYEIEGDTFRVCVARPGDERPAEFSARVGSGRTLVVYQREKKEEATSPSNFNPFARGETFMTLPESNLVASNSVDRATFENLYAGPAPWDIGRPQGLLVAIADRVLSPVLDAGCGTGEHALFLAAR